MAANNGTAPPELEELADLNKDSLVGPALATAFDIDDRFFSDFKTGDVYENKDPKTRQLKAMLGKDGNAKKLEQILTLPIRSASYEIRGNGPAGDFLREVMTDILDRVIDQCSIATIYRKTFFEKIFKMDGDKIIYGDVAWRPPISCEAAFDRDTAKPNGFRQRLVVPGGFWSATYARTFKQGSTPGYAIVPKVKSFIYTHGTYRDPLNGVSDMDVAVQAYETKEKLKFLWFEFLENQARPKLVVYDNDLPSATDLAKSFAQLKGAGVMGMRRPPDPAFRAFETIEPQHAASDQFIEAIRYLEQQQTNSVLAGFTDLTQSAGGGAGGAKGSYALSSDSSEYFLASRQAVADEISQQVECDLFAPLIALNFGADEDVPEMVIGPIGNSQTDRALSLLNTLAGAPTLNVPPTFVDQLLTYASSFLGLSQDEVEKAVEGWRQEQDEQQAQMQEQMKQQMQNPQQPGQQQPGQPGTPLKPGAVQPAPGRPQPQPGQSQKALSNLSTAVDATTYLVNAAQAGIDPKDAAKTLQPKARGTHVSMWRR